MTYAMPQKMSLVASLLYAASAITPDDSGHGSQLHEKTDRERQRQLLMNDLLSPAPDGNPFEYMLKGSKKILTNTISELFFEKFYVFLLNR